VPALPELPTLTEQGVPIDDVGGWTGMFVPARTPAQLIAKLNIDVRQILLERDVQKALTSDGTEFGDNSPEYVKKYLRSEIERWSRIIRSSGVQAE
jgi:tripartite-type tricarboxylate transporter receptor subunit TctC